jgi:hypothetical protein
MAAVYSNWLFVDSPDGVEFQTNPQNAAEIQKRIIRVFVRRRLITGLAGNRFTEAGTKTTTPPTAYTGTNSLAGAASTGFDWVCTGDDIRQVGPPGTDVVEQVQTWISYTPFELFTLEPSP